MKKFIIFSFLITIFAFTVPADIIYPDGRKPFDNPEPYQLKKISRGIANVVTFAIEVPKAFFDVARDEGVLSTQTFTLGLLTRGPYNAGLRLSSGLNDLATFDKDNSTRFHLEPEYLGLMDLIPGYRDQFSWDSIDTTAGRVSTSVGP